MSPSFLNFKEIRRRSRNSFRTERSTDGLSEASNGTAPTTGSLTPPSFSSHQSDPAPNFHVDNHQSTSPTPPATAPSRPAPHPYPTGNPNRYSVSGMSGLGSPMPNGRGLNLPVSQYSPRIASIQDNTWVYQKVLLVYGTVGEPSQQSLDGTVTVSRLDDSFPPISWPVCDSHFKALVYMTPGANRLRFDFASPKLANSGSTNPLHASYLTIHMLPATNPPPLQLAILLAKDSPATYDAVPARIEQEGNGLETAIRKFRMAAYLWQAFTAEQMWRNKFGRRVFRFEEEWTTGSANQRDREQGTLRSEARIHIIRTNHTLAELRDMNKAQQNKDANQKDALFGIAADAVRDHFQPLPGQKLYVSVLLLDSHWDTRLKTVTAHAALGGGVGDLQLAVFGSHCLQSYPTSFEEVVPAFSDCTPTDTNYVANDCNEAGSSWEAANIGIGAHLHETGHLFGLPHRESGVMLRDYVKLNRTFMVREAYSVRTRSKGGPVSQEDECTWHRLDCLRFRSHPCFRLPNDLVSSPDDSVQAWPVGGGEVLITAASGIMYVEIFREDDDVCHKWIEYLGEGGSGNGSGIQRQITLNEQELRKELAEDKKKRRLKVNVRSHGGGSLDIEDFHQLCSKQSSFKLPMGLVPGVPILAQTAYRGKTLGASKLEGSEPHEVVFTSAVKRGIVLTRIIVYHGMALDGLEFAYDDGSTQLFGKKGGKAGGDIFEMDIRRGEYVTGFYVRAGFWIDGIQIFTSSGRKSPIYGKPNGGSGHTLIPPRGFNIVGVTGSCGAWVDGFSVIISKLPLSL